MPIVLAALVCAGLVGAAIGIERPLDRVLDEAVPEHGAAVIEHDRVGLARRRAAARGRSSADKGPSSCVGRARMQQPTSGMSQPSVSTMQLVTSSISPDARRASVASRSGLGVEPSMCSAAHAGLDELIADVDGVRDVDGEGDGLPALAVLVPMRDDVADQLRPIHALGELALDVVAGARA